MFVFSFIKKSHNITEINKKKYMVKTERMLVNVDIRLLSECKQTENEKKTRDNKNSVKRK